MIISSGDTFVLTSALEDITVKSGGIMLIHPDGAAAGVVNSGLTWIASGGFVSGLTNYDGAVAVFKYASASNIEFSSGFIGVEGSAADITIHSGGTMRVDLIFNLDDRAGTGDVSAVTISSGGTMMIRSGCTALAVTSMAGATVINSGGYIEYVTSN
jgi:uncharacterized protein YodC (DUF2158 family)